MIKPYSYGFCANRIRFFFLATSFLLGNVSLFFLHDLVSKFVT